MVDITDANPDTSDVCVRGAYGPNWHQLLKQYLPDDVPAIADIVMGHGKMLATTPIGVKATLVVKADRAELKLLESALS